VQFLLLVTAASDLLVHKILLNSVLVSPIAFAIWGIFWLFGIFSALMGWDYGLQFALACWQLGHQCLYRHSQLAVVFIYYSGFYGSNNIPLFNCFRVSS